MIQTLPPTVVWRICWGKLFIHHYCVAPYKFEFIHHPLDESVCYCATQTIELEYNHLHFLNISKSVDFELFRDKSRFPLNIITPCIPPTKLLSKTERERERESDDVWEWECVCDWVRAESIEITARQRVIPFYPSPCSP